MPVPSSSASAAGAGRWRASSHLALRGVLSHLSRRDAVSVHKLTAGGSRLGGLTFAPAGFIRRASRAGIGENGAHSGSIPMRNASPSQRRIASVVVSPSTPRRSSSIAGPCQTSASIH